ncbi:MAG TPA: hypothetical protein VGM37_11465 [Armatimonadota bacterium]|jgi:hypothetical protein
MPYFTRVFTASDDTPPINDMRVLVGQYAATITVEGDEDDWDIAALRYDDEEEPVDIERYLPATDGLFEEDINDFRSTISAYGSEAAEKVLSVLDECRQIICFRVPDEADDTVWAPLNAAVDALTHSVGGLIHAEKEGFYDGPELILPLE